MMIFVFDWIENIVGKIENVGKQHFLLLPQIFQRPFYSGSLKVGTLCQRDNLHMINQFGTTLKLCHLVNSPKKKSLFSKRLAILSTAYHLFNPVPFDKFSSELKELTDENFKFDKNGKKFSRQVENTVGKGEIAHYEQFLLFPQCFQKTCNCRHVKTRVCLGYG